uniref:Uncharacterized protein n=1 Tax=Oryza sativa subsp. japonica TaxID=39947 RepID=Q10LM6_ORYSJ|nr:hypothetical protein LOC_Os03g22279 [Oryza sativa Japonica Group]
MAHPELEMAHRELKLAHRSTTPTEAVLPYNPAEGLSQDSLY